jgi:hypothetical protein
MNTRVGKYIISTVGEYHPAHKQLTRENVFEFEEIGCDRLYETMVFKAVKGKHDCCPWEASVCGGELDFAGYNTAGEAMKGHIKICKRWAKKQ